MKKIFLFIVLVIGNILYSQVIFGDAVGTAADKTSVLVEFANSGNRGFILPYLTNKSGVNTAGSIIIDATNPATAKAQYYNGTSWVDLSVRTSDVSSYLAIQPSANENAAAKVIVGSDNSTANGVLVLESSNKAMVLPIVTNYKNIINPAPGTVVLVNNSGLKSLAVYDGTLWNFWSY